MPYVLVTTLPRSLSSKVILYFSSTWSPCSMLKIEKFQLGLSWVKLSPYWLARPLGLSLGSSFYEAVFRWGCLPVRLFLWGHLPVILSSCAVIFLWGCLPVRSSSCEAFFLRGCLPVRTNFYEVVFLWVCLSLRMSHCEFVFRWGRLPVWSFSSEVIFLRGCLSVRRQVVSSINTIAHFTCFWFITDLPG